MPQSRGMKRNNYRIIRPGRIASALVLSTSLMAAAVLGSGCQIPGVASASATTTTTTTAGGISITSGGSQFLQVAGKVGSGLVTAGKDLGIVASDLGKAGAAATSIGGALVSDTATTLGAGATQVIIPTATTVTATNAPVATP